MSLRTILLILVALTTAAVTALYARNWLIAERAELLASVPSQAAPARATMVLVARKDFVAGSFLRKDDLRWQAWPEDGVLDSYVVKGEREATEFSGSVVRTKIVAGEPVTDARVVQPGDRGFLAAVLEPGKRAVSVPVNATTGISGFVFPGDWVDVILTGEFKVAAPEGQKPPKEKYTYSETLLTDVRVLAVDQDVENEDGKVEVAKTATIEVDPKQAEKIAIGIAMGHLSLSLHSLAREQDDFSKLSRSLGADPSETADPRSYTLDDHVIYMTDKLYWNPKAGAKNKEVQVLRGSGSKEAKGNL